MKRIGVLSRNLFRVKPTNPDKLQGSLAIACCKLNPKLSHFGSSCFTSNFSTTNFRLLQTKPQPNFEDTYTAVELNVGENKKYIDINWKDGHASRFHASWMRFNCECPKCKRNITGESNVDRSELPDNLLINEYKIEEGVLKVWLEGEAVERHVTQVSLKTLRDLCYSRATMDALIQKKKMRFHDPKKVPLPVIDYCDTRDDLGRFNWFKTMIDVGFTILKNTPTTDGKCLEVAEEISPLVYGTYEKMFNVMDTGSTANLAYTTTALPLHQDVVHLEAAPGIQLLHALRFDEQVVGGNSILVDMFECVRILRQNFPDAFDVLARVPVTFSITDYEKDDPIHVLHRKPIINLDYDDQVVSVAWNPGTEQPLRVHEEDVDDFFSAYKKLHRITVDKSLQFNFRLNEGDLLLFNNRRFLHSRDAYKSNGGTRLLQGTYCSIEELRNKYVILGRKLGIPVVDTIVGNGSSV